MFFLWIERRFRPEAVGNRKRIGVNRVRVVQASISEEKRDSESLFSTCKGHPSFPDQPFADVEEARIWTQKFARWYDSEHHHSGLKFVTPDQRHRGEDIDLLAQRHAPIRRQGPNILNAGVARRATGSLRRGSSSTPEYPSKRSTTPNQLRHDRCDNCLDIYRGQGQAACRALQQTHPQPLFQGRHSAAQPGLFDPGRARGGRERHGNAGAYRGFRLFTTEVVSTYPQNIAVKAAELTDPALAARYLRRLREASAAQARCRRPARFLPNLRSGGTGRTGHGL